MQAGGEVVFFFLGNVYLDYTKAICRVSVFTMSGTGQQVCVRWCWCGGWLKAIFIVQLSLS